MSLAELYPLIGVLSSAVDSRIPRDQKAIDVVRTAAYGQIASWRESYDAHDDDRALALMASLGVGALVDRFFSTLSSGEKKRVGIARALMPNPEVLILDEPTSGLVDLGGRYFWSPMAFGVLWWGRRWLAAGRWRSECCGTPQRVLL